MPTHAILLVVAAVLVLLRPLPGRAQTYDLSWHTVDGGGATFSTAPGLSLGGTIGQPDAGRLTAPGFTLDGGFWRGTGAPCLLDVDGNGRGEVATDVVYLTRTLLGFAQVVPPSFRTLDPAIPPDGDIVARIVAAGPAFDVDLRGGVQAATDTVYIARARLGLPQVVPPSFRTLDPTIPADAAIAAKIQALCP